MSSAMLITETLTYLGPDRVRPTPADTADGGLPRLLDRVSSRLAGVGVVLVDAWGAGQLGLPGQVDDLPTDGAGKRHPAAVAARTAGWEVDEIHRWSVFRRSGQRIAVGVLPLIDGHYCPLRGDAVADTVAAMALWGDLSGTPWWGDAADAVSHLVMQTAAPKYRGKPVVPVWTVRRGMSDGWIERPFDTAGFDRRRELPGRYLIGLDQVRCYLGALGATDTAAPWGLKRRETTVFDPALAGWWLVDLSPWTVSEMPPPWGAIPDRDLQAGMTPLTTETCKLLAALTADGVYGGFRVREAWTSWAAPRLFRPAAERLSYIWAKAGDLENVQDRAAIRDAVSAGYKSAHGKWRKSSSDIFRPDWAAAWNATGRCNLWRRADTARRAGFPPAAIGGIDTVWFATDHPDHAIPGFPIGEQLGQFRRKYLIDREA
jgi:hypothetical protein